MAPPVSSGFKTTLTKDSKSKEDGGDGVLLRLICPVAAPKQISCCNNDGAAEVGGCGWWSLAEINGIAAIS